MKIWRIWSMSENAVVQRMIEFIEEKESQFQASKFANDNQVKTNVVKLILDELEREMNNEDQQNRI